jgi:hypothetical protein
VVRVSLKIFSQYIFVRISLLSHSCRLFRVLVAALYIYICVCMCMCVCCSFIYLLIYFFCMYVDLFIHSCLLLPSSSLKTDTCLSVENKFGFCVEVETELTKFEMGLCDRLLFVAESVFIQKKQTNMNKQ